MRSQATFSPLWYVNIKEKREREEGRVEDKYMRRVALYVRKHTNAISPEGVEGWTLTCRGALGLSDDR